MEALKFRLAKRATKSLILALSSWYTDKPDYPAYLQIIKDIDAATNIDQINNSLADAWNLFDIETLIEKK